jgi:chemotaxis protein histidine kinase CheA
MSSQSSNSKGKIVLKKNKIVNKIWHPESTLVFSPEKLVIGRFKDGSVISLDDYALDLCVQWKFKYDTSLVEEEDITDSDDEEPAEVNESDREDEPEPEEPEHEETEPEETEPEPEEPEPEPEETEPEPEEPEEPEPEEPEPEETEPEEPKHEEHEPGNQVEVAVSILRNNIDRILNNVLEELSRTKDELATMTKDFEDTKDKLAKIRSALG